MRRIDTRLIAPVARPETIGPAPDLRWIDIAALRVDPAYQRDLGRRNVEHIRKIAAAFDWRLFSVVVVSPLQGGVFAIVDGQHRTTAAALCGIESVPCQVIQADAGMQARAFEAINGSTIKVTTQQRFKAAVAGGDAEAVKLQDVANQARIKILGGPPSTLLVKPGDCIAIVALQKVMATFSEEHAQLLLECVRLTVTRPKILIRNEMILAAIDAFKEEPVWFSTLNIKAAFARMDQESLFSTAREMVLREEGLRIREAMAAMIVEEVHEWMQSRGAA